MSKALYIAKKSGRVQVCVTDLPASIEAYLVEAGFSQTEIMALKKLLEGEALTLRELAAKTGKSTGVLDQAVKKLLSRRILCRETVNDTPKMLIKSIEPILQWMKRDTEEKLEAMKSRARNFETFINSLKVENKRPEMEYFEGEEGIKKAYLKLLELDVKEFLHYRPVTAKEEEDPLREFRVQYFRGRHKRSIFSRVLASNTPLGRRFQSRDAFEYRETQLLKEEEFPITFEKIIANGTVACFNHAEQRACYLKYPELANTERMMFELLWRRAKEPLSQSQTAAVIVPQGAESMIALSTRSLSSLREFFLSRKSVWIFFAGAVLAVVVTYGLWRHTYNLNLERVREQVIAITATAAPEFDAADLNQLHKWEDTKKPVYRKVVEQLQGIRRRNPKVRYAYIMRPTDDPYFYQFVADADALDIRAFPDSTGDGLRNDVNPPGYSYYDYEGLDSSFYRALHEPDADLQPCFDLWGVWISGHAPIQDTQGNTVAIIGMDIDASEIKVLSEQSFSPILFFIAFFLLFILVRLAAFNRPLFFDLLRVLRSRGVLTVLGVCALIALGVTWGMYRYTLSLMKEQVGEKLMAIASTAAVEIDAKDLEPLRFARDMKRPEYQKVFNKLNEIRDRNKDSRIIYAYIFRPTADPTLWEFVADADSNYNIPLYSKDYNSDGVIDGEEDENVWPGVIYDASGQEFSTKGLEKPMVENFSTDQWGTFLTGDAPIRDASGKGVAILGLDMDVTDFYRQVKERYTPFMWFLSTLGVLMIVGVGFSFRRRREKVFVELVV
ncbi:MAG: hypothetical protein PHZ00_05715 [Candidatus Peribacteraceae bacterium]|nr:hypothetical protein [Candidatus Peribacteraceae bacterium]